MKSHLLRPALRPVAGGLLSASLLCNAAHAAEAFDPHSKWMLGDWGGKRTELLE
ncbi:porin, partial [Pseudomonas aeruginosa]|nr:porin [Pseudomonas aeruginosa]NQB02019.1 porin [Pseudomonas paraeruginosa]